MHTLPAQVVCAMCVCRSWYAAGGVVFNAAMASASLQLRCTLPTQQCVSGAAVFACCEEGLGEGPLSMEECVAFSSAQVGVLRVPSFSYFEKRD
eukprot:COSAG02_NODE_1208_length_13883_cov_54.757998_15_plen_93_part_01